MGAKTSTLDNYVRSAGRSAPVGKPVMDQPRTGKPQRAADDARAKADMLSEGGSQDTSARTAEGPAR